MDQESIERAAKILRDARVDNYLIDSLPEDATPRTVDDGYAVQRRLLELLPEEGAGWLLGLTNEYMQNIFHTDAPYYARILRPNLHSSPVSFRADAFLTRGIECEVVFRMSESLPPRGRPYDQEEVADAVVSMSPSIEVVNAHFADWLNLDLPNIIADNGTDGALVVGPAVEDWRSIDRVNLPVVVRINGEVRSEGKGANALGDPLKALTWLANALNARGTGLKAGEVINTGTCTVLQHAEAGDEAHATFGDLGEVRVTFA